MKRKILMTFSLFSLLVASVGSVAAYNLPADHMPQMATNIVIEHSTYIERSASIANHFGAFRLFTHTK